MLRFAPVLAAVLLATAPAAQPVATPRPDGCTYDACALRVEPGLFSRDLLQGVDAVRVGRFGIIDSDLEDAVAGSEYAVEQAREYDRSRRLSLLSGVAGVALLALSAPDGPLSSEGAQTAAGFGALALGFASVRFQLSAERALSRAVWEYNRVLPTDVPEADVPE